MSTLKRKSSTKVATYSSRDNAKESVIEIDERRSYDQSQSTLTDNVNYTKREDLSNAKTSEQIMPVIKNQKKPVAVTKQSVSSKTKLLLAAYIIIAVVLIAVVIGTGVAISEIGGRADKIESNIDRLNTEITNQNNTLTLYSSDSFILGEAHNYGLVSVDDFVEFSLAPTVEIQPYTKTSNAFDRILDFLSRIFS